MTWDLKTLWRAVVVAGLLVLLAVAASAQGISKTVIRADGYVDVEAGRIVTPAVIVVANGRIVAVNPERVPDGAEEIDVTGHILLPGLMDAHTHLTFDIAGDWVHDPVKTTAADAALRGARNAKLTLMAGFTTVRDVGARGFSDISLMHAIDQGFVPGPRIIPSGHSLSITGGHCEVTGFAPGIAEGDWRTGVADGVDEVVKAVRYQIKHGAKSIKICATAGVLSFEGPVGAQQYSIEEMRAIVEEAERHGIRVAAHAHGKEGIIAAARAGIHSIEHDSMMDREAARIIKKAGAWVDPNLYLIDAIDLSALPPQLQQKMAIVGVAMRESFRIALDMDLKIAFGTDAAVYPHGENGREFTARVAAGQSPADAIRSATIVNAELLQLTDRGRIAEGLLADIIAVMGNPLEDISLLENPHFIMKDGEVYKRP